MKNLSSLLARFSNILNRDAVLKETAIEVIKAKTGINLPEKYLSIKSGVLELDASPAVKNEVRFKESQILADLPQISRIFYK